MLLDFGMVYLGEQYYNNVMEDAETPTLDLGELRKEIGSIKGVGEKRLDEIMTVIEKHLGIN